LKKILVHCKLKIAKYEEAVRYVSYLSVNVLFLKELLKWNNNFPVEANKSGFIPKALTCQVNPVCFPTQ